MTPKLWLSLEFCNLARPGRSRMNSESVDRQVSSMLDSEFLDRQGPSLVFSWFHVFLSRVDFVWWDFHFLKNKHKTISALRGSFLYPFDVVLTIFGFRSSLGGCHEKVEFSWKCVHFMKKSRFHEKDEISWKKDSSLLALDVCFQVFRAVTYARGGGRFYESSRAVNMVDGLPHAPSYLYVLSTLSKNISPTMNSFAMSVGPHQPKAKSKKKLHSNLSVYSSGPSIWRGLVFLWHRNFDSHSSFVLSLDQGRV